MAMLASGSDENRASFPWVFSWRNTRPGICLTKMFFKILRNIYTIIYISIYLNVCVCVYYIYMEYVPIYGIFGFNVGDRWVATRKPS